MKLKIDFKKRTFNVQFSKIDLVILDYFLNDHSTDIKYVLDTISNLFYTTTQRRRIICLQ